MARRLITSADEAEKTNQEGVGFFQGLVQSIARPFLKTATSGIRSAQAVKGIISGEDIQELGQRVSEPIDFGYFGAVRPAGITEQGEAKDFGGFAKDVIGTGVEVGSTFTGGRGAAIAGKQLLKGQLGRTIATGTKTGATAGALAGGGQSLQRDEGVIDVGISTALGAGLGAATGAGLGAAGAGVRAATTPIKTVTQRIAPALQRLGEKIETTVIKPVNRDMESGFKAENVFKHKLAGNLQQTYDKATAKLARLRSEAAQLREGNEKVIDVQKIMSDVVKELSNQRGKLFGVGQKIGTAVKNFGTEFEMVAPDGKMTVPQAQEIKEALGTLGSWLYGNRDLDANAQERVANILYTKIKVAIEKNSKEGLAEINRRMSEIIPIKNAVIRRIPIAERNNILSLTDILSAGFTTVNPKGWWLIVLNRLAKSGRVAGGLFRAGEKLKNL